MTTNRFADLVERLTFEKVKEHVKSSPLDIVLYGVGIGLAGWALDAYGVGNASAIAGAGAAALGLPLIGGLSVRWAFNRARGRRSPFISEAERGYLRRLLQTACNVFAWCASKLGRPTAAAAVLLLGAIIGMTPGEVVRTTRWEPMTEFSVAYPQPTWRDAAVNVTPFTGYGQGASARINAPLDYRSA